MIKKNKSKKNEFLNVILFCLILDWGFSFMIWGAMYTANEKPELLHITAIIAICILKPVCGIITNHSKSVESNHKIAVYFGISTVIYSLMFFWLFYESLYKVADVQNPLYLVLGAVGYIVFLSIILHYRYGVFKGKYKDKSGTPKYSIVGLIIIVGSIFVKGYLDKLGEGIKALIMATIALIISYVFSMGGALLLEYLIFRRLKKSL